MSFVFRRVRNWVVSSMGVPFGLWSMDLIVENLVGILVDDPVQGIFVRFDKWLELFRFWFSWQIVVELYFLFENIVDSACEARHHREDGEDRFVATGRQKPWGRGDGNGPSMQGEMEGVFRVWRHPISHYTDYFMFFKCVHAIYQAAEGGFVADDVDLPAFEELDDGFVDVGLDEQMNWLFKFFKPCDGGLPTADVAEQEDETVRGLLD